MYHPLRSPYLWVALVLLTFAAITLPAGAEEGSAEEEAAIMQQEDLAEAQLPIDKKPTGSLLGRIQLKSAPEEAENNVVGLFASGTRTYLLQLTQPALWDQLRKHNGKTVTLFGKIRMRGKYFIAEGVQVPTPGPKRLDRDRRAGM